MAPTELSWIDAKVWKDVWAHRQGHEEFMKDEIDRIVHPNGHFGILNAARTEHSRFRRNLSHAFSEKGMREQQPHITGYVDMLMKDLKAVADDGPQDLVQWFNVSVTARSKVSESAY
jgi:cytochrome P450